MAQVQEKRLFHMQGEAVPRRSGQGIVPTSVMFAKKCLLRPETFRFINEFIQESGLTSVTAVGKAFPHRQI
jgi:hypothetical protein